MLKNYLRVALRSLTKQKVYTFVNIIGLAVGLACFILIQRYVQYELSFDTFHEKADRIHRIVQRQPGNIYMGSDQFGVTPAPLARTLIEEFPEVTGATTIDNQKALLSLDEQHFYEDGLWGDESFFEVFTFPMTFGDARSALSEPYSIVLTSSLAEKIFGNENPMGQTVVFQNEDSYSVTGIIEDVPKNSHFTFSFVASIISQSNYMENRERWNNNSWFNYFVLQEGVSYTQLQKKLPAFTKKYIGHNFEEDPEDINQYYIQPLTSIHLHSHINFEISANNDIKYIYMFSAIAIVILLIACVNYMNLATARSINRAREVGMRKVVGAHRLQLVLQFIGESVLLSFLSLILALAFVHLLLPVFGRWMERDLTIGYAGDARIILGLIGIALFVGIVSGSYPAAFMSSMRPIHVLKGAIERGSGRSRLQRFLVIAQYTISIILVIGSVTIYRQLQFIQNEDMGYDREHVVVVRVRDQAVRDRFPIIRNELLRNPNIVHVATSASLPTRISSSTSVRGWEGSNEEDALPIYRVGVSHEFLDVFDIELIEGRNFSREFTSDTSNAGVFLLNETAVKAIGWDSAVGKRFNLWENEGRVIGVVKDFHMHSLHLPIEPLMLSLRNNWASYLSAKVGPDDIPGTVAFIANTMKDFTPFPFEYEFLDDTFDSMYKTEMKLGQSLGYFTLLALLIASMGLFGLAAFSAEQRTKEIGVRKVLGSSVPGIVLLLSKDFTKLVFWAFVPAVPAGYYAMSQWLENFAFRIQIGPVIFLVALLSVLLIAWLSVSYQAVKAARVNPVKSIQYE